MMIMVMMIMIMLVTNYCFKASLLSSSHALEEGMQVDPSIR